MDWMTFDGVPPYDGRYPLVIGEGLTTREWGWIKRLAGYLPIQVDEDAFGDPEFVCVLAAITLRRAGKIEAADLPGVFDQLVDAPPAASFRIETDQVDEPGDDARPPARSQNGNADTSGPRSPTNSGRSGPSPPAIGMRASATSRSGRTMSGT